MTTIREAKGSVGDAYPSDWWRGKCTIVETVIMDFECVEGLKAVARGFHPNGKWVGNRDDQVLDVITTEMHVFGDDAVYECIKAKMVSDSLVAVKANTEDDGAG